MNKVSRGHAEQPRSIYDNYKLYLDSDLNDFRRDKTETYVTKDLLNTLSATYEENN